MKRLLAIAALLLATTVSAAVRVGPDVLPVSQSIAVDVDPRKDDYTGSVKIDLNAKKQASSFLLHAEDLTVTKATVDGAAATSAKDEDGTISITPASPLKPGKHTLSIDFTNKFNRQAVGLYKMTTKDGEPYLFTQFEAIDARRAFPIFDEPGIKIPYELTVTFPDLYDAVANTPVANESKANGMKTVRFAKTRPLPAYLIAFAVGRFDYTPINGMSVPGRVIAPKGQARLTQFAAQETPAILAALEKYFGQKYPFEKVDLIAVPEYWAGAMENPGLITYRDTVLLVDAATATPGQKQNAVRVTAHELSHMWFGDLVTMEWWDDLWLNESFADWMGDKITDQVHPEYHHLIGELRGIQRVMDQDALATTDPIRKPGIEPEEAMRNVGIAYDKGKAVLTMFERWIGAEKFRQGVLDHIKNNSWGNANAPEFFTALARHAPKGTAEAMQTFVMQPGVPLVTVSMTSPNEVLLTQSRFATGPAPAQTWRVPVTLRYSDGTTTKTAAVMLDGPSKTLKLEGGKVAWVYPHAHAAGYYRWKLPEEAMTDLASHASQVLEPEERLAFIGNAGALFSAGMIHGDTYLDLLSRFSSDPEPEVLSAMMGALSGLRFVFETDETRPLFASYLRRTLGPVLDRIGMTPKPGEADSITSVRPEVISVLAAAQDERVWKWIDEQLPRYLADPTTVHPTLAGTLLAQAATRGDDKLFEEYRKRFENAALPAERSRYLGGLGRFRDPAIKTKMRAYALNGPVRTQEVFALMGSGITSEERDDAYAWATANFDALLKKIPPGFASSMAGIAGGCELERVEKAREFFATKNIPGIERRLAQVEESVKECSALRAREMNAVKGFLTTPTE